MKEKKTVIGSLLGDKKNENEKNKQLADSRVDFKNKALTTDQGVLIEDTDNSLKAGTRGPLIMEDFHFREKMTHFDHERIPERIVHARGSAAHGYFQVYKSMEKFTKAKFLQDPSVKTPVFVRFSTVVGFRGSADTVRDVRGFATKFYTEEGNYDLVGNNMPVFFIQDAIKFPDLVHSIKPEPHHEMPQASAAHDNFWDFVSLTPESTHMLLWVLSDRALPRSYATMEGFGVHTFRWINAKGESRFVKYHWKPIAGVHSLTFEESQKVAGQDPDFNRRDLWESMEMGMTYEYELGVQIIEEQDVEKFEFDLLDATKSIPEEQFPVMRIGKMILNRNPDNFFLETEQVAFHPGNVVPGIDLTNDPLLQGRLFSYLDTQLIRLGGPNFAQIPINKPLVDVTNNQQDGYMRMSNMKGRVNYSPSSMEGGAPKVTPEKEGGFHHYPEKLSGTKIRERSSSFSDHYSQATLFYNSMTEVEKQHILDAASFELGKVEAKHVRERMVSNFSNVDSDFARKLAEKVGVEVIPPKTPHQYIGKLKSSEALSQMKNQNQTAKGRNIAVIVHEGFEYQDLEKVKKALEKEGARTTLVSDKIGMLKSSTNEEVEVGKSFSTTHAILYDGLFIPGGDKSVQTLLKIPKVPHFIEEIYRYNKPLACSNDGMSLLKASRVANFINLNDVSTKDEFEHHGFIYKGAKGDSQKIADSFVKAIAMHRHWERKGEMMPG